MADRSVAHANQVRELFDAHAASWSARYTRGGHFECRLNRFSTVLDCLAPPPSRVLDLGCGTGELASLLAASGRRITACDISEQMLRSAAIRDPDGPMEWVRLDPCWQTLPFATATFDAVVAASVFEYVNQPAAVIGECARILRPGGVLVLTVPDLRHPIRWLEWLARAATRLPLVHYASRRWPFLESYIMYIRTSRQRHTTRWWNAAARMANLRTIPCMVDPAPYSPLRLVAFRRREQTGENL